MTAILTRTQPAGNAESRREPSARAANGRRRPCQPGAQHQAGVWRYVRFLGADAREADDLTQETFLALARGEFVERDERQTAGYLRVVARNQLLALRRKQNREISTVELEAADSVWAAAAGPDGSLAGYLDALRECVEQLEGRCAPGDRLALPRRRRPRSDRRRSST